MNEQRTARPAGAGPRRRSPLFTRKPDPDPTVLSPVEEEIANALTDAVDERIEEGLTVLEEQAAMLMREVASELWRASAKDVRPEQERIVSLLSRDQAIRSLIASSDERFQALSTRAGRVEDALTDLAETGRATRAAMESSAASIRDIADSPTLHGVEGVRLELEQVERHIAETFENLDERDRMLTESILIQVREHGELVARETSRVVEAMQGYVQGGAEAVGRLAQRVEEHAESFATQDGELTANVGATVRGEIQAIGQQLDLMAERMGIGTRDQVALKAAMERFIDARVRGLAELVRSDSQALRGMIEENKAEQERMLREIVEERMILVGEALVEKTGEAAETAIAATIGETVERLHTSMGAIDGIDTMLAEQQQAFEERMRTHVDDRVTAIARLVRADNQALAERFATAGPGGEDAELLRQTLRSIKELHAGMANDVLSSVDRRFQAMSDQLHKESQAQAEAMLTVAERLSDKIDRVTVAVDEGYGNDVQIVVDRMSEAIQAMSGRSQRRDQGQIGA
jgi:DNA primase large subunit